MYSSLHIPHYVEKWFASWEKRPQVEENELQGLDKEKLEELQGEELEN